jgi:hypothetical protein
VNPRSAAVVLGDAHSARGRNDLKTKKRRKRRKNGKTAKNPFLSQLGVFVLNFVVFGLVLTIFEVILANSAMNRQKHNGRLLLEKKS